MKSDDLAGGVPNDMFSALAAEVVGLFGTGRPIIAIDGPADRPATSTATRRFADRLADGLRATDRTVARASLGADPDLTSVRALIVVPFREAARSGAIDPGESAPPDALVVDGAGLLAEGLRDLWHHSVWLERSPGEDESRDVTLRLQANAIIDTSDAEHPRRIFADFC